jgi:predicted Zn-dependent peptidase
MNPSYGIEGVVMKTFTLIVAWGVVLLLCAFSANLLASEVFYLPNGMQVILKENHTVPMISSVVVVKAGGKYETDEINGVSHLLEHLLFDGTKTRSREDITEGIKSKGGYINAFTRKEMTGYIILMPKEEFEFGLEIQADMLFNSIFPEAEIPKEKKVVIEEIQKDNDNIDYIVERFFDSTAFAFTPYAIPVLGNQQSVSEVPAEKIQAYYHQYYLPNNMTILAMGDFDSGQMRDLLWKHFNKFPAGNLSLEPKFYYSFSDKPKIEVKQTSQAKNTYLNFAFPAPDLQEPDFYSFEILAEILNSEETSPLSVLTTGDKPLAVSYSAYLDVKKEFCTLNLGIVTDSAEKVQKIIEQTLKTLQSLSNRKFTKEEIDRVLIPKKTGEYLLAERPHYYWMMKAPFLAVAGWEYLESEFQMLSQVKPGDLKQAAAKYFSEPVYIGTVVMPPSQKSYSFLRVEQKEEGQKQEVGYLKKILPNGLTVLIKSNPASDVFAVNILGKNRALLEPEGKEGIADFTNRMLLKGTKSRLAEEIQKELQSIGAQLQVVDNPNIPYDDRYLSPQFTYFRFESIDEFAAKSLDLIYDQMANSIFPDDKIEETRKEILAVLKKDLTSPSKNCSQLFYQTLFQSHPYHKPFSGTVESISSITQDDLLNFHSRFYSANNLILTVAAGLSAEEIFSLIEKKFSKLPYEKQPVAVTPLPTSTKSIQTAEKKLESQQLYLYIGSLLPDLSLTDKVAVEVANSVLSSRLGLNLREKQGLAYSVASAVRWDRDFGWFYAYMGTSPQNFDVAREGILNEIKKLQTESVSAAELEKAKNDLRGSLLMSRLSSVNQAFYMSVNEYLGLGYRWDQEFLPNLAKVTAEKIRSAFQNWIDVEHYVLTTAGKK